jgi:hypothetical protein
MICIWSWGLVSDVADRTCRQLYEPDLVLAGTFISLSLTLSLSLFHLSPPPGQSLYFDFDAAAVHRTLSHLRPDNMLVQFSSSIVADQPLAFQTERWYGARFAVEDIDAAKLAV